MSAIELLQQIGLNKYEAEAYYALLAEGPLTGYELGKRSQVPLSRSYEILERLTQKGLALIQPGDPPRYLAEDPERFLGQVRAAMVERLDTLAGSLAELSHPGSAGEFWVLRGRQHILNRVQAMIANAQQTIEISLQVAYEAEVREALALSQARGCSVFRARSTTRNSSGTEVVLLLVDGREALAGMLVPIDRCQAVVSANQALVTTLQEYFAGQSPAKASMPAAAAPVEQQNNRIDWLAWEERKQRRLWNPDGGERVA